MLNCDPAARCARAAKVMATLQYIDKKSTFGCVATARENDSGDSSDDEVPDPFASNEDDDGGDDADDHVVSKELAELRKVVFQRAHSIALLCPFWPLSYV